MDYLKSEHLKFKRTISNKLIFIVPLITAIFAWIMGGYGVSVHDALLVVCVLASGSNRNFVFFVTQKRRKRREILFGIFYACKPFEI